MTRIIAIAINEYDDPIITNLNNCKTDIEQTISAFTQGYQIEDVEFVHSRSDTTRKNLYALLRDNLLNALENDSIIVLFGGHGEFNKTLHTCYWQPSDATQDDPSSWLNISELLLMLKASQAKHISIISDSCFAGAIFENPSRGGGITAYEASMSRSALTSGGIEKVSDGTLGDMSPFTKELISQLKSNDMLELPFTHLANSVLLNFSAETKQTPKFGGLQNVGHDGGSLILQAKSASTSEKKDDSSLITLQSKLSEIVVPNSKIELRLLDQLKELKKKKNEIILAQQYEKAAELRDDERRISESFTHSLNSRLEEVYNNGIKSSPTSDLGKRIDDDYEKYKYSRKKSEEIYQELKSKQPNEDENMEDFLSYTSHIDFRHRFDAEVALEELQKKDPKIILDKINPNSILWEENRFGFIENLNLGLFELMAFFGFATGGAKNEQILIKLKTLEQLIIEFNGLQILKQSENYQENFDDIVKRKNLEVNLLNWLRDI